METKLLKIAEIARQNPKEKFTSLSKKPELTIKNDLKQLNEKIK